jgi:hypothetical protein
VDNSRSNGDECRKQVLGLWTPRRAGLQITWTILGTIETGLWTAQPDPHRGERYRGCGRWHRLT